MWLGTSRGEFFSGLCSSLLLPPEKASLIGFGAVEGDADLEVGGSGFGLDGDETGVSANNAGDGVEAEAEAAARRLGSEEGLKDARLDGGVDARAVVPDLDGCHFAGEAGDEA